MRSLYLLLLLTFSLTAHAVSISWLGGTGNWNNPAKWSTGTVPTSADDVTLVPTSKVIIPNNYHAQARSVFVGAGTLFSIERYASLTIQANGGGNGIENEGEVAVKGQLDISGNIYSTIGIWNEGKITTLIYASLHLDNLQQAIHNEGEFHNGANVHLSNTMHYQNTGGIYNNGDFTNNSYGDIDLHAKWNAIHNTASANFTNAGRLNIYGQNYYTSIYNGGLFTNTDQINFHELPETGISNHGSFVNEGLIGTDVVQAYRLIENMAGEFTNTVDGHIIVDTDYIVATIYNEGSGTDFYNYGQIGITQQNGAAIQCEAGAIMRNKSSGEIMVSGNLNYFIKVSQAHFRNEGGQLMADAPNAYGVYCSGNGLVQNLDCGNWTMNCRVWLSGYGGFRNFAWMEMEEMNNPHYLASGGYFKNYGVISDRSASLTGIGVDNYGIIVDPLDPPGGVTEGQPIANALWVGSLAGYVTVATNCTETRAGGAIVGAYDDNTNTFTASSAGVGHEVAWLAFTSLSYQGNCTGVHYYALDIPGGIQAASPLPKGPSVGISSPNGAMQGGLRLSPHPVADQVNISIEKEESTRLQVQLFSLTGQMIFHRSFDYEPGNTLQLQRPNDLPAGVYLLSLSDQTGWTVREKVVYR